jgi:hypothetical protein
LYAHEKLKEARHRAVPVADFDRAGSLGISARSSDDDLSSATLEADPWLSCGFGLAFRHRCDRSLESGGNQAAVSARSEPKPLDVSENQTTADAGNEGFCLRRAFSPNLKQQPDGRLSRKIGWVLAVAPRAQHRRLSSSSSTSALASFKSAVSKPLVSQF